MVQASSEAIIFNLQGPQIYITISPDHDLDVVPDTHIECLKPRPESISTASHRQSLIRSQWTLRCPMMQVARAHGTCADIYAHVLLPLPHQVMANHSFENQTTNVGLPTALQFPSLMQTTSHSSDLYRRSLSSDEARAPKRPRASKPKVKSGCVTCKVGRSSDERLWMARS